MQTISLIKKTLQVRQLSNTEEHGLLPVITEYANYPPCICFNYSV
jgi:hypothetical protein